eukprot:TRINITY_DN26611_c0_g1_i1.p1 TRINITY_DN26611_c0_g1~~TRINITY_DN26611_c0_g1_i1.p1  ORF type:complete len:542 (-),score=51.54 TRINITY_DN26611_c0_g1_i1:161-1786(-)
MLDASDASDTDDAEALDSSCSASGSDEDLTRVVTPPSEIEIKHYHLEIGKTPWEHVLTLYGVECEQNMLQALFPRATIQGLAGAIKKLGSKKRLMVSTWPKPKMAAVFRQTVMEQNPSEQELESILKAFRPTKSQRQSRIQTVEWFAAQLEYYAVLGPDDAPLAKPLEELRASLEKAWLHGGLEEVPVHVENLPQSLIEQHKLIVAGKQKDAWEKALKHDPSKAAGHDPQRFMLEWDRSASKDRGTTLVLSVHPLGTTVSDIKEEAQRLQIPVIVVNTPCARRSSTISKWLTAACKTKVVIGRSLSSIEAVVKHTVMPDMDLASARLQRKIDAEKRKADEKETQAVEMHNRKRRRLDELANARKNDTWDVRGIWSLVCREAEKYDTGSDFQMEINGDGKSLLVGSFDLGFLRGHFKLEQPCASEGQARLRMKFGARETGEGEMSDLLCGRASDTKSFVLFSNQGRSLIGEIQSDAYGLLSIYGGLVRPHGEARLPSPQNLHSALKQYTEGRYESERIGRWGRQTYASDLDDQLDGMDEHTF